MDGLSIVSIILKIYNNKNRAAGNVFFILRAVSSRTVKLSAADEKENAGMILSFGDKGAAHFRHRWWSPLSAVERARRRGVVDRRSGRYDGHCSLPNTAASPAGRQTALEDEPTPDSVRSLSCLVSTQSEEFAPLQ